MASTFIFTNTPYPKSSIPLGSLVPNIGSPNQDGFPVQKADPQLVLKEAVDTAENTGPESSTASANPVLEIAPEAVNERNEAADCLDYTKCLDKDFHGRMKVTSGSVFKTTLTKLMSIGWATLSGGHLKLSSLEAFMYELKQPNDLFQMLCTYEKVQKWLEASLRDRQTVHFVVGVRTMKDALLFQERDHETHTKGEGGVQVEELVGVPPIAGDLTRIKVEAAHDKSDSVEKSAKTIGERIYAVCYRKVHVKVVNGSLEAAHLGKNKWVPFARVRSDAKRTEEIVTADLDHVDPIEGALVEKFETDRGNEVFISLPETASVVPEQQDQALNQEEEDENEDDEDESESEESDSD